MASSKEVFILGAARTPVGNLNGALSTLPACELGSIAIQEALQRAGMQPELVSDVLMGHILTAGEETNTRFRQCILNHFLGLPWLQCGLVFLPELARTQLGRQP